MSSRSAPVRPGPRKTIVANDDQPSGRDPLGRAVSFTRTRLATRLTPWELLLALRDDAGPFALTGRWAASRALLGSDPLVVHEMVPARRSTRSAAGASRRSRARWGARGSATSASPSAGRRDALRERLRALRRRLERVRPRRPWRVRELAVRPPGYEGHRAAIATCLERIGAGEIYQANLCMRFEGTLCGEAIDAFAEAGPLLDAPHAAFLGLADGAIMSFSPELFLRRSGRQVITAPIKGTARRSADPQVAAAERRALGEGQRRERDDRGPDAQ